MAVQTQATGVPVIRESLGSLTFLQYQFTSVATGDTFNPGLGNNVVSYDAVIISAPSTQADAGVAIAYNATSGVFTLYPAENSDTVSVQIFARI